LRDREFVPALLSSYDAWDAGVDVAPQFSRPIIGNIEQSQVSRVGSASQEPQLDSRTTSNRTGSPPNLFLQTVLEDFPACPVSTVVDMVNVKQTLSYFARSRRILFFANATANHTLAPVMSSKKRNEVPLEPASPGAAVHGGKAVAAPTEYAGLSRRPTLKHGVARQCRRELVYFALLLATSHASNPPATRNEMSSRRSALARVRPR